MTGPVTLRQCIHPLHSSGRGRTGTERYFFFYGFLRLFHPALSDFKGQDGRDVCAGGTRNVCVKSAGIIGIFLYSCRGMDSGQRGGGVAWVGLRGVG